MNRVYKVIWSKAKHCYVVTSEIARSVTKSASSARSAGRKGAAVLAMAALLFTAGGVLGEAANVTDITVNEPGNVITVIKDVGDPKPITIDNVAHAKDADYATAATKAYSDGDGLVIKNTYAKVDTDGKVAKAVAADSAGQATNDGDGNEISSTYVKNDDANLDTDGNYVKTDKKVGENLSALDTQVKANADAVGQETLDRKLADKDNLKVGDDGVISKVTGDDGTTSSAVKTLVLNKDGKKQITLSEDGIKVGKNSTTMDENGFYAGSDYNYGTAKAALDATEGKIRGADGNFQVNADGKVTAKGGVETAGAEIKTGGGSITAGKITGTELNTQGGAITGGMATVTGLTTQGGDISGGNITATGLNTQGGEINGGDIKSSGTIHATGKITGNGLDAGTGAISGGSLSVTGAMEGNSLTLKGGNLNAGSGTITTTGDINGNNINTTGKITTKDLEVTGGLKTDHITLGSEDLNQTDINKGKVTSKIHEISGAVEYTAESIFNKDGSSITVRTNEGRVDSTGSSTVGSQIITQYLGNNAVPGGNNVTRRMVRNDNGTFSMVDTAVNGKDKYSIVSQNAEERKVTVTEGTKTLTVTKNLTDGIVSETNGGAGKTVTLTQGMDGTYKVETDGTSTEDIGGKKIENYKDALETTVAKDETHYVKGNQSNKVDGTLTETVKGKVTENYQDALDTTVAKDETHYVKGNQSNKVDGTLTETVKGKVTENYQDALETTVTGDSSLSATNIKNKASTSITNQIGNGSAVKSEMTADGITNMAEGGTIYNKSKDILNEASGDIINWAGGENGEIGNVATKITNITGDNTVTSDTNGTTFENKEHSTAVKEGTVTKTTISGNTIETGQATMDYADVTKDLSVGGNATVTKDLTVKGASEFADRADFRKDVYMWGNLEVTGETRTDTLYVDHDGYVGGNLNVDGNIETHDAVLSADSRQVVTGRQLYQTNERVDRLDNRIKKVGANAAALAALRPGDFNPDDKFSIAAGFGSYRNANAAALGLFYRPNENVLLSLGTSFGDGENMVNAGVSVKFGRGKSMAERRKEMADEVSSMRDEMRSQDERIAELEEMLKKQSELIEKLSKES